MLLRVLSAVDAVDARQQARRQFEALLDANKIYLPAEYLERWWTRNC